MILFHGSPDPDLKVLDPKAEYRPPEMKVKPVVFATTDLVVAALMSRRWISGVDVNLSTYRTKKGIFLEEARPGGFEVFDGPAYIYVILNPGPFKPPVNRSEFGQSTYISEEPTPVIRVLDIPNVLEALKGFQVNLVPYGARQPALSGLAQVVYAPRQSILKRAMDPTLEVRLERNEKLWKAGKGAAWWRKRGSIWLTLYRGKKAVAMAAITLPIPGKPLMSGMIAYVVDPTERGKEYGEVIGIRASVMALQKFRRAVIYADVRNIPSIRTIIAIAGALRALHGRFLRSKHIFAPGEKGEAPWLFAAFWLD